MTSRKAPAGPPAIRRGWVYTLHLLSGYPDPPCPNGHQVRHYSGWAKVQRLGKRLRTQAEGGPDAVRLLQVQIAAGGTFQLVAFEFGTVDRETQLKERGASRRCWLCIAEREPGGMRSAEFGWVYVLHLDPPRRATLGSGPWQPAHRVDFTADTQELLAATGNAGQDAAAMLRVPRPQAGRWRLVSAQWAPRDRVQQLTEGAIARCCPA